MGVLMGVLMGLLMGYLWGYLWGCLWGCFSGPTLTGDAMAAIWWEILDSKHRSILSTNFQAMAKGGGTGHTWTCPRP